MSRMCKSTLFFVLIGPFITIIGGSTSHVEGQQTEDKSQIETLHYNATPVAWQQGSTSCLQNGNGSLLHVTKQSNTTSLISGLRQRFHPDAVWVGDYKVFDKAFSPPNGFTINQTTDRCVGLTITSISLAAIGHVIQYKLSIQPNCGESLGAMCICQSASGGAKTLSVKTLPRSWIHYQANNCGRNCQLWNTTYDARLPEKFGTLIGHGNVTLNGLSPNLLVGRTYWINILARLSEKITTGEDSIIECGYIPQFDNQVVFGSCNEERAYICETSEADTTVTTTTARVVVSTDNGTSDQGFNNTSNDLQTSNGLSVAEYAGFIGGGLIVVLGCVIFIFVWKRYRQNSINCKDESNPKGGRSFMRQKPKPEVNADDDTESKDDYRFTLYAKIDPLRVRNTLMRTTGNENKQPDIVLTAHPNGYLPMNGFQNQMHDTVDSTYDVIRYQGQGDNRDESLNVYSVSMETEAESEYNTTLDRHPSRRALITDSSYDRIDLTASASMDNNVCNSIGVDDENYSSLQRIELQNPTYDRIEIH